MSQYGTTEEGANGSVRAGKLPVPGTGTSTGAAGVAAAAVIALAGILAGCGRAAPSASPAPGQTAPALKPSVTPSAVPALGELKLGTFPDTWAGVKALQLCEDWAALRGQYAARVMAGDTPFQLEQWFSGTAWQPALSVSAPLQVIPAYSQLSVTFGLATVGQTASITQARGVDAACTAAD